MVRASAFKPAWWLKNRHLQTIVPNSALRRVAAVELTRETVELPDGDFLHADWIHDEGPIVLILHGLEGSAKSRYATGLLQAADHAGLSGVVLHLRGCSGIPNRLNRGYHAGETGDLAHFLQHLEETRPGRPIVAVGISLGGNILLKYLGETGIRSGAIRTAVAVSVPFDLQNSSSSVHAGFSRLYGRLLLRRMKAKVRAKFTRETAPFDYARALRATTFGEFDDAVTAPLHGFADVHDYYRQSSCRRYLKGIRTPTLLLQAADDPFMSQAALPREDELSDSVTFELSERGGHVGFVAGTVPWRPEFWLESRIAAHCDEYLGSDRRRLPGGRPSRPVAAPG